jgi:hypothetical protein
VAATVGRFVRATVGRLANMTMDSVHVATSIERPAAEVYAFVADPANLPAWAHGLAEAEIERIDDTWTIQSPMGTVTVSFAPANAFGVVDHDVTLPSGEVVANPLRVIPNAAGCDVLFTVRRRPAMSAAEFEADVAAVTADLATLRTRMEAR